MDKLISDSYDILRNNEENINVIYDWMDIGDKINENLRDNLPKKYVNLIISLTSIIKEDIILFRGITTEFDSLVASKQFNSLTPNLNTALTYGKNIIKIIVPKGNYAFYISAWELINQETEQEEKEVILLPGLFTFLKNEDTPYMFIQRLNN